MSESIEIKSLSVVPEEERLPVDVKTYRDSALSLKKPRRLDLGPLLRPLAADTSS